LGAFAVSSVATVLLIAVAMVTMQSSNRDLAQSNRDLQEQVDTLSAKANEQDTAIECSRRLASEESIARFGNEIKFNRYVLALGGLGDPAVSQQAVLDNTAVMEEALAQREAYQADPVKFCESYG
jgi:hypothetical protein